MSTICSSLESRSATLYCIKPQSVKFYQMHLPKFKPVLYYLKKFCADETRSDISIVKKDRWAYKVAITSNLEISI